MLDTKDVVALAKKAVLVLCMDQPDLALAAANVSHHDGTGKTPTAHVTLDGKIYYNSAYIATLTSGQLLFIVAHEIGHLALCHFERFLKAPDRKLANIACDMSLNKALLDAGLKDYPIGALFPLPGMELFHAERIYDELAKMKREDNLPQEIKDILDQDGPTKPGQGCGPQAPENGESGNQSIGEGGDQSGKGAPKSVEDLCADWAETKVQAEQMAIGSGKGSIFLTAGKVPPSRVKWKSVVKRGIEAATASLGRDDQTWVRRGRRSGEHGPQFAGWQATRAKIAVVIDSSGSMSDEMLHIAISETVALSRDCKASIYLAIHDHGLQWGGWLADSVTTGDITKRVSGRGGTCCKEAYANVEQATKRFGYFIHLTDGGIWGWPAWPKNCAKRVVALIGHDGDPPSGCRVIKVDI